MNELKIKGILIEILKGVSGISKTGKEWKKQEFVIETKDQYPKKVCFTLFGEKSTLIKELTIGDEIEVSFYIESREYNEHWFHNINAWKIDILEKQEKTDNEILFDEIYSKKSRNNQENTSDLKDDLPF